MTTTSSFYRLLTRLREPVDSAWLAAFRVLFGLTLAVSIGRFIWNGWIDTFYVRPTFRFSYFGFEWLTPLSDEGFHLLFWVLGALAVAVALGFLFRLTALLFALGFAYLQLLDVGTYLNHYYLAALLSFLLWLSPAHRTWSLDRCLFRMRSPEKVRALWLYLFRFQLAVVYTFAGLAKATPDWLWHAQPLGIWISSHTDLFLVGPFFRLPFAAHVMSWAGFLFDMSIAWLLLVPRLRPFAYPVLLFFHSMTSVLFPIGMFPVIMTLGALVFFSPSWPRRLLGILGARLASDPNPATNAEGTLGFSRLDRLGLMAAASYCVLQLAMPLRYLAYGGNVLWHEQGMRFSWRVMVREKNGSVTFVVREPRTGKIWHVSARRYLNPVQEREMSTQPDLILQLAHRIRDDYRALTNSPVEVRAEALVSLNGRRIHALIDPNVDLATVQDSLLPARFILPSPVEAPPHLKRI
ncbi:MAG: HTTM domain-containing protein [Polyangiaceae bacterium]|nr:HTTM domain-containing protein [Polyangiaceae bacterium]